MDNRDVIYVKLSLIVIYNYVYISWNYCLICYVDEKKQLQCIILILKYFSLLYFVFDVEYINKFECNKVELQVVIVVWCLFKYVNKYKFDFFGYCDCR